METCCQIGALSATDNKEQHEAMKNFGTNIGIAFQIRDDILDYNGATSLIGKPVGGDIKEKKITLPLIYSLNQVPKDKASAIRNLVKNGSKKDNITEIIDFVQKNKGIEYALETANSYSNKAKESLKSFPDSPAKLALEALVDFVIDRKN